MKNDVMYAANNPLFESPSSYVHAFDESFVDNQSIPDDQPNQILAEIFAITRNQAKHNLLRNPEEGDLFVKQTKRKTPIKKTPNPAGRMKRYDVALDSGWININCNGGCIFIHKVVKSE